LNRCAATRENLRGLVQARVTIAGCTLEISRGAYKIRAGLAPRIIFLPTGDPLRRDFIGARA
jgi:hypothetical protein